MWSKSTICPRHFLYYTTSHIQAFIGKQISATKFSILIILLLIKIINFLLLYFILIQSKFTCKTLITFLKLYLLVVKEWENQQ